MAATYDLSKLKEYGKDRMRFVLGDTSMKGPLLQDEEIQFIIDENPGQWKRAKLRCAEAILAKMEPETSIDVGPLKIDLEARIKTWTEKVQKLQKEVAGAAAPKAAPGAGGEPTEPYFKSGMHNF